jgi:cytosine/adenosine deaminase-related metal-dependent hydrolase
VRRDVGASTTERGSNSFAWTLPSGTTTILYTVTRVQPALASSGMKRAALMVPMPVARSYPGMAW